MNGKDVSLKRARDGFAHWRATRKGKEPIPKALFELAARAVEFSDVSSVAFELGLNTGRLARGLDEVRLMALASVPNAQSQPAMATSEGLHFSRFDGTAAEQPVQPTVPKKETQKSALIHAEVRFESGIVVSLHSLASVRVWCREAAQAARQGGQ